jgi:hypothetical protein
VFYECINFGDTLLVLHWWLRDNIEFADLLFQFFGGIFNEVEFRIKSIVCAAGVLFRLAESATRSK